MEALAAALPPNMTIGDRQHIGVKLPAGQSPHLESYGADWAAYPTAGVSLSFAVSADRAREFAKLVAGPVQSHLDRMTELQMEFHGMTGFFYIVMNGPSTDFATTFSELEAAARTVNNAIAGIPEAKLAPVRRAGPAGWVQILLETNGFGAGTNALYPVEAADRTFLDIAERNRRDAEQGNITIRD
jgi:hypothetical protein